MQQILDVVPQGLIKRGQVELEILEVSGAISSDAKLTAGIGSGFLQLKKEFHEKNSVTVDPKLLVSANLKKGQILKMGAVTLTVLELGKGSAKVLIRVLAGQVDLGGSAIVDTTGKTLRVQSAVCAGSVFGYQVTVQLQARG